jgi:transposase
MATVDLEAKMTIKKLYENGCSKAHIAALLRVTEGTVRYHVKRIQNGAHDGRADQTRIAAGYAEAIDYWQASQGEGPINLADLHAFLVAEQDYPGSRRSVERYYGERYPAPKQRARRRVETPPGAQAQVDWAVFPAIHIGCEVTPMLAFHLELSHSRYGAVVWSRKKDLLSWLHCHNEALKRVGGVPATLRVDNEKTAVSRGAGAWAEINETYRRYAKTVRFHIDPCPPRSPNYKGKVERRIRDHRLRADPSRYHWREPTELQAFTDERLAEDAVRRRCPATGTRVLEAWEAEREWLAPLPILPEPFDHVATRRVSVDCLVSFEGRQYSVPFTYVGQRVEVRGCAGVVQVLADTRIIAVHPRHTFERLVLDPTHFEGEATETVLPPPPLGRMGRRLQEIAAMKPEQRPMDLYAALAEVAR